MRHMHLGTEHTVLYLTCMHPSSSGLYRSCSTEDCTLVISHTVHTYILLSQLVKKNNPIHQHATLITNVILILLLKKKSKVAVNDNLISANK